MSTGEHGIATPGAGSGPTAAWRSARARPTRKADKLIAQRAKLAGERRECVRRIEPAVNITKAFIQTARGVPWTPPNGLSWNDCIHRADRPGYARIPGKAHVGDIVLVKGTAAWPSCAYHHSGVVTEVNEDGTPKTIRQKDGPSSCVVDLSWADFQAAWLNRANTKALIYTNPNYAGKLPLWD